MVYYNNEVVAGVPLMTEIINALYPVGSLYISVSNTLPDIFTQGGATWEKLPDGYSLWSASSNLGSTNTGVLPNIKGDVHYIFTKGDEVLATDGAFGDSSHYSCWNSGSGSYPMYRANIHLDASKSNNVYSGTDATVRPTSINVSIWKRTA